MPRKPPARPAPPPAVPPAKVKRDARTLTGLASPPQPAKGRRAVK